MARDTLDIILPIGNGRRVTLSRQMAERLLRKGLARPVPAPTPATEVSLPGRLLGMGKKR